MQKIYGIMVQTTKFSSSKKTYSLSAKWGNKVLPPVKMMLPKKKSTPHREKLEDATIHKQDCQIIKCLEVELVSYLS